MVGILYRYATVRRACDSNSTNMTLAHHCYYYTYTAKLNISNENKQCSHELWTHKHTNCIAITPTVATVKHIGKGSYWRQAVACSLSKYQLQKARYKKQTKNKTHGQMSCLFLNAW